MATIRCTLIALLGIAFLASAADCQETAPTVARKLNSQELADWIDQHFADQYQKSGAEQPERVDNATFLRRIYLDLQGRVPTVAQLRDFLQEDGSFSRQDYVDRLLYEDRKPERFATRSAKNLASVWRRMMIPSTSPNPSMGSVLEPWLAQQFLENKPYNEIARELLLVKADTIPTANTDSAALELEQGRSAFAMAIGRTPENLAGAYVRVFLGIRLHCAQCHDHPTAEWKQEDFWGVAALLNNTAATESVQPAPVIKPSADSSAVYPAKFLWTKNPLSEIPASKAPSELFADWVISPANKQFAATTVNRVWQYLCGRGLAGSVDDLDQVPAAEREMLDGWLSLLWNRGTIFAG